MAQSHGVLHSQEFCCPICLELLKDPVAIPCGHSYCMSCIRGYWAASYADLDAVSCPQCRQSFLPRPILKRNTLLAEMVDKLKKTTTTQMTHHLQVAATASNASNASNASTTAIAAATVAAATAAAAAAARTGGVCGSAGAGVNSITLSVGAMAALCLGGGVGDASGEVGAVLCDLCTSSSKLVAVKSCLVCLASYCKLHLQAHHEAPALRRHKLVEAMSAARLQENLCPQHDKLLEIYCRSDQRCVCVLCVMEEHKGHDTVSATAEGTKKQKELGLARRKFKLSIHAREKELLELQQAVDTLRESAQGAMETSDKIFTELMSSIGRRHCEVRELIKAQERAAAALLARLQNNLAELRKQDAQLELLLHTDDHIHFLQCCQSLSAPAALADPANVHTDPLLDFGKMTSAVFALRKRFEDVLKVEWPKITRAASTVKIVQSPEPNIHPEFLYYSCPFKLDPKTAHKDLSLSQDNGAVTVRGREHSCTDHPERFDYWCQVLASEGLSGRCYWEAEWSGMGVNMAVAYRDVGRKGEGADSHFGRNDRSWSLFCSRKGFSFWHNNVVSKIAAPCAFKIGIYLDHRAGTLSFYSVSDTMTLLHRVKATFTQALYPGYEFACYGASVKLCQME
ncbi:tripartite motif-containing protein 16 [Engraulis encrasicolus]|uniref:tripartite motif-containing protein 16 n=1 Tax=Engraulis encrasicolus TaxID=184585 RepID=UPI002FD74CC9